MNYRVTVRVQVPMDAQPTPISLDLTFRVVADDPEAARLRSEEVLKRYFAAVGRYWSELEIKSIEEMTI